MRLVSRRGIGIIQLVVAFGIVTIAVFATIKSFKFFSMGVTRVDRNVKGDQVLINTVQRIWDLDYVTLRELCKAKNALNKPKFAFGACTTTGPSLNEPRRLVEGLTVPTGVITDATLEVPRDFEGRPSTPNKVCIELKSCVDRAGGLILEAIFQGYWLTAQTRANNKQVTHQSKILTIRRTRW